MWRPDISREQYEEIRAILESARKRTKPQRVDLYEVFCAVLYLLKSGCQWRMRPGEFPKWKTVHSYFAKWSKPAPEGVSLPGAGDKNQVGEARIKQGRSTCTSFLIVDAQSIKNTDSAEQKSYDAGKKVSSIKRHIAVDAQGIPHVVAVTTAEVTDRKGAVEALSRCRANLNRVQSGLADGDYTGQPFAQAVTDTLGATVQIVKRSELHTFAVMPQRWVVERSFAWLEKCRCLWRNCERKLNTASPIQFTLLPSPSLSKDGRQVLIDSQYPNILIIKYYSILERERF